MTRFLTSSKESNEGSNFEMEIEEITNCPDSPTPSVISHTSSSSAFFDSTSMSEKTTQPLINTCLSNIKMYEGNKTFYYLYLKKLASIF